MEHGTDEHGIRECSVRKHGVGGPAANSRAEDDRAAVGTLVARCAAWLAARCPSTLTTALRSRFLPYLIILLIAWTPWLVLTWPGALRDDTLAQYLQSSGIHHYYTQHPLFDTLIFGLFWRLGGALGSPLIGEGIYTVVQVLGLAAGASLVLCYIRKLGVPRWLRMIGLIYLATSYVVVGSVSTMGKDSLHTIFFLPMAVIFVEACLTCGRVLVRTPVAVAFTLLMFAVIASKRTALVIMICAGIGLLVVCRQGSRRHDSRRRRRDGSSGPSRSRSSAEPVAFEVESAPSTAMMVSTHRDSLRRLGPGPAGTGTGMATPMLRHRPLVCLVTAIVLAQGVFAPIATAMTHANVSPGREVWGLVTQPVAQVAHDEPSAIDSDQRRALNAIMDLDKAARNLNPHRSNETFETLRTGAKRPSISARSQSTAGGVSTTGKDDETRHDAVGREASAPTTAEKLAALKVWMRLGLTHPGEYMKAYVGVTRGWWDSRENFAYPTDSDYLLKQGYLRQWATFLPPEAGIPRQCAADSASDTAADSCDADTIEALRIETITRDLRPLAGTSDRPQWKRTALRAIRDWVRPQVSHPRENNPLTAMAFYVTWIPLAVGIVLIVRSVMRRRERSRAGDTTERAASPRTPSWERRMARDVQGTRGAREFHGVRKPRESRESHESQDSRSPGTPREPRAPWMHRNPGACRTLGTPSTQLAAYGLLFFTVLSLYASPEALFWYPIPVFLSLPLFTALPFRQ